MKKYSKGIKGNKLAELIALAGIDKKKLAKMIGLKNEHAITNWENGKTIPDCHSILKLCVILKTNIQNIYPKLHTLLAHEMEFSKKQKKSVGGK